jgi:hypothetical protein
MFNKPFNKTEVWTVKDFMARRQPTRVEGGVPEEIKIWVVKGAALYLAMNIGLGAESAFAAGPFSNTFDTKIWPVLLDIGKPLAKTMMAIGIYKCIRNDVENGWKMVYRSGVGLAGLYLIDGAINIVVSVGNDLAH